MHFRKYNPAPQYDPPFEMPGMKISIFLIVVGIIALTICFGGHSYTPSGTGTGWVGQISNGLGRMDEFTRLLTGVFCGVFPLVLGLCFATFNHLGITFKDKT